MTAENGITYEAHYLFRQNQRTYRLRRNVLFFQWP
jgi:hypothetical protein